MEIFSPKRFTKRAGAFGLRPGLAIDLEEGWDLDKEEDVVAMMDHLEIDQPVLLTGSPPCEAFSQLRHIGMAKRDPEQVRLQRETAERRLRIACRAYKRQYDARRLFLQEHPDGADSWDDSEVKALEQLLGVYRVRGPMCHWEMLAEGRRGDHCG